MPFCLSKGHLLACKRASFTFVFLTVCISVCYKSDLKRFYCEISTLQVCFFVKSFYSALSINQTNPFAVLIPLSWK